jgi:hypothetical protein
MRSIVLITFGLVCGQADAQAESETQAVTILESNEPRKPSGKVYRYAGSCGQDRYEVEMLGSDRPKQRPTLSLRVNGNPIVASEMDKLVATVPAETFIYEPVVDECLQGVRQARLRLMLWGPALPDPRWRSFLMGDDGRVTGFKELKRDEIDRAEGLPDAVSPRMMTMKRREASPTAILYSVSGSCGWDRYETELRGSDRPDERSTLALRVNGHPVTPNEMERLEASIPEDFAFDRAVVQECPRGVQQARIMLTLGGTSSPELRGLSFLVGVDGRVTGIK